MKRILLVLVFAVILAAGAFADHHPSGLGLGIIGRINVAWYEDLEDDTGAAALSLKIPWVPIFWGASVEYKEHAFGLCLTGDYYLIDNSFVDNGKFGWYFGFGGYASYNAKEDEYGSWASIHLNVRVPIGISFMPVRFFEIYVEAAPGMGIGVYLGEYSDKFRFPDGGFGFDMGLRFWF